MSKRLPYDPTLNTLRHVKGSSAYQNGLRRELDKRLTLTAKYIHRLKTQEFKMQDAARIAESKRIDEQLILRDHHDREKADMMAKWQDSTATAFASALNAVQKTSNERLDRLEKFMYEQSGRGAGVSQFWGVIVAAGGIIIGAVALFVKFG